MVLDSLSWLDQESLFMTNGDETHCRIHQLVWHVRQRWARYLPEEAETRQVNARIREWARHVFIYHDHRYVQIGMTLSGPECWGCHYYARVCGVILYETEDNALFFE